MDHMIRRKSPIPANSPGTDKPAQRFVFLPWKMDHGGEITGVGVQIVDMDSGAGLVSVLIGRRGWELPVQEVILRVPSSVQRIGLCAVLDRDYTLPGGPMTSRQTTDPVEFKAELGEDRTYFIETCALPGVTLHIDFRVTVQFDDNKSRGAESEFGEIDDLADFVWRCPTCMGEHQPPDCGRHPSHGQVCDACFGYHGGVCPDKERKKNVPPPVGERVGRALGHAAEEGEFAYNCDCRAPDFDPSLWCACTPEPIDEVELVFRGDSPPAFVTQQYKYRSGYEKEGSCGCEKGAPHELDCQRWRKL